MFEPYETSKASKVVHYKTLCKTTKNLSLMDNSSMPQSLEVLGPVVQKLISL